MPGAISSGMSDSKDSSSVKLVGVAREEYVTGALSESDVGPEPIGQFRRWFEEARAAGVRGLDEIVVATVGADGQPSARVVLLKAILGAEENGGGIVFVTNYGSRKGREAQQTGRASVCVWWKEQERQVRWEGRIKRAPAEISDAAFRVRPREAQIGAWASAQSEEIPSRETLERAVAEVTKRFEGRDVPRPEGWGAFVIRPERVEFWQGRVSRLHDRLEYVREGTTWRVRRLSP